MEKRIQQIFDQFDKNKNGSIERNELKALMIALNEPLSNAELLDLFRCVDKDNSGIVTWDEFKNYWEKD